MAHPGGRPRIIKSPEQMDELVDAYVAECEAKEKPLLLTGMILHLGLNSRAALDEYEKRPEFFNSVKRAKLFIEMQYEGGLQQSNVAGSIFALKNFGWKDKTETEITGSDGGPVDMVWTVKVVE